MCVLHVSAISTSSKSSSLHSAHHISLSSGSTSICGDKVVLQYSRLLVPLVEILLFVLSVTSLASVLQTFFFLLSQMPCSSHCKIKKKFYKFSLYLSGALELFIADNRCRVVYTYFCIFLFHILAFSIIVS